MSILAYAGLRPGELRALRWSDVREHTILVQRAANPDGSFKDVKNHQRRTVKLLLPLEHDLSEHRPRSAASRLILADADGRPWDKDDWQRWRNDRWKPACRLVGLQETPRPYDLRHSFASLLLAEGRHESYVSRQLGHSLAVLRDTYAHLIDEFEDAMKIDANTEILKAREQTHRTGALAAA